MGETAPPFNLSSGMCNKFRPRVYACAAILADGSVVAWGNQQNGGDCSAAKDEVDRFAVFCSLAFSV